MKESKKERSSQLWGNFEKKKRAFNWIRAYGLPLSSKPTHKRVICVSSNFIIIEFYHNLKLLLFWDSERSLLTYLSVIESLSNLTAFNWKGPDKILQTTVGLAGIFVATDYLTLFRPGFFWCCGTGGGRIPPPPLNSKNIEAMTTKLKGQICTSTAVLNISWWRHMTSYWIRRLGFLEFSKTLKNCQNWSRSDQNQYINREIISKCKSCFKRATICI